MKIKYLWEKFGNPRLAKLKKDYHLEDLIVFGKNEFEKQLLLKEWVNKTIIRGIPSKNYDNLSIFEILSDNKAGKKFWCTQYAFVFLQCATALGWYVRKLMIDFDHNKDEKSLHHGIVDIWSNQYQRWYVVDAYKNIHFEKNKIPLNAVEIRNEYLKNKAKNIKGIIGDHKRIIKYNRNDCGINTPSNYFWLFISLRNNFFEKAGLFNTKGLLWVDKYNSDKLWYKDSKTQHLNKTQFIKTNNIDLCFPKMSSPKHSHIFKKEY